MRFSKLLIAAAITGSVALTGCNSVTVKPYNFGVNKEVANTEIYEVHEEGRIYVFYDMATYNSFLEVGETAYRLTRIGGGPHGETLVFGLPKKDKKKGANTPAAELFDGKRAVTGEFYGELRAHGRIYVFNNRDDMDAVRLIGEPSYMYTQIGAGPKGETVVFVLNKSNKKKKPVALMAKFAAKHPVMAMPVVEPAAAEVKAESKSEAAPAKVSMELYEVVHDGRINVFYDKATHDSFLAVGETAYRLTRIGGGPKGETLVFGLPKADKKKGADTPAVKLFDGELTVDGDFYGEMRRHGRIYVFNNVDDMKAVRELGEPSYMYTQIGAGPQGETVVYVLNKSNKKHKPVALMEKFAALNPVKVAEPEAAPKTSIEIFEVFHDGRINVFYDKATHDSFLAVGETAYRLTRIGGGPNGETVVFGLPKADKKKGAQTPAAMMFDGNLEIDGDFYGEMRRHGRIYVFNTKADMDAVRQIGEPSYMYTEIGAGPNGETVVFVLNKSNKKKKPVALIEKFNKINAK